MTLLLAIRGGRVSTCDHRCWTAATQPCRCPCEGLLHGVGVEEAGRLIASLDLATLAGVIVMPELPFGAAESLVAAPEPPRRVLRRPTSSASHCDGCGRPWGEVVLWARVAAGVLCDGCWRRLDRLAS